MEPKDRERLNVRFRRGLDFVRGIPEGRRCPEADVDPTILPSDFWRLRLAKEYVGGRRLGICAMGVLFVLYDWSEAIEWQTEEVICVESLRKFGRHCERFVYSRNEARPSIRKTSSPSASLDTRMKGFGAYDFGGGEVNLPAPHAQAATYLQDRGQKLFLFFVNGDEVRLDDPRLQSVMVDAMTVKTGGSGFARNARREDLPEAIALGVSMEDFGQSAIGAWHVARRDAAVKDRHRILRNVFTRTILPNAFLTRRMFEGMTLAEWVEADPRRGRLKAITPHNAIWSVADKDLEDVRAALRAGGILAGGVQS